MKKVQKFLAIFAVVIICLGSYAIINGIYDYDIYKKEFEKVILMSQVLLEENLYGEATEATKQNEYYNFIQNERKQQLEMATTIISEVGIEKGLKSIVDSNLALTYEYVVDINTPYVTLVIGKLLIWSIFISNVIFFALEAKYTNLKKYLLTNVLMIALVIATWLLAELSEHAHDILSLVEVLPFVLIYMIGLITNIKVNMYYSFRMNIIYAVFAVLAGIILGGYIIEIYLGLSIIDVVYNAIKLRRNKQS